MRSHRVIILTAILASGALAPAPAAAQFYRGKQIYNLTYWSELEAAIGQHILWGTLLLGLIVFGPGLISVDAWLESRSAARWTTASAAPPRHRYRFHHPLRSERKYSPSAPQTGWMTDSSRPPAMRSGARGTPLGSRSATHSCDKPSLFLALNTTCLPSGETS